MQTDTAHADLGAFGVTLLFTKGEEPELACREPVFREPGREEGSFWKAGSTFRPEWLSVQPLKPPVSLGSVLSLPHPGLHTSSCSFRPLPPPHAQFLRGGQSRISASEPRSGDDCWVPAAHAQDGGNHSLICSHFSASETWRRSAEGSDRGLPSVDRPPSHPGSPGPAQGLTGPCRSDPSDGWLHPEHVLGEAGEVSPSRTRLWKPRGTLTSTEFCWAQGSHQRRSRFRGGDTGPSH